MARRIVGREMPSRSASTISLSSSVPWGRSPAAIDCSRCCATWNHSGIGLDAVDGESAEQASEDFGGAGHASEYVR